MPYGSPCVPGRKGRLEGKVPAALRGAGSLRRPGTGLGRFCGVLTALRAKFSLTELLVTAEQVTALEGAGIRGTSALKQPEHLVHVRLKGNSSVKMYVK